MISMKGSVVAQTKAINGRSETEVELDPEYSVIGRRSNYADLRHITLKGPDAENLALGDRIILTIEKVL